MELNIQWAPFNMNHDQWENHSPLDQKSTATPDLS